MAKNLEIDELVGALQKARTPGHLKAFLFDLCTPSELEAMVDRWRVVQLLKEGCSYREIAETTGVSTATITRVARSLNEGDGYKQVLDNVSKKTKQRGTRNG